MTAPRPAPVLSATQVSKRFGDVTAVDDVSIDVMAGEVVGLLGANGAGKTTLITMLLGLARVTSGRVALLGGSPDRERRRRLGYVPQGLGLYQDLTVAENLEFACGIYGVDVPEPTGDLTAASDRLVSDLPLGTARQVAFAVALAHRPRVLVLDEPTSGVDALARARLWDTIRSQADDGVGVLVTTHYMEEAQQCDRLVLMASGRVVGRGSEDEVIGDTRAALVRVDDWARAFDVLNTADLPVILAGRDVRVVDTPIPTITALLTSAGLSAQVDPVPATLEERMLALSREVSA